jgi:hypothetical protein
METTHIYILTIAIIVVAIDILVRVRVAPRGRDAFYKALIEMGAGMPSERRLSPMDEEQLSLARALLQVFQESFASRQVITALAKAPDGLNGKQLEDHVRDVAVQKYNRPLSINAIRRVVMILMGANIVDLRDGKFGMTGVGWTLHSRLETETAPAR